MGNLNSTFNLQAKVGWAPQFWAYGTTNVGMGGNLSLQDVPSAKAWAFGPFAGLDVLAGRWNPSTDEEGPRFALTPTVMGGLHVERAVDISVSTDGYGDAEKREKISVDLSATYGVVGPRRGLGGMLQLRYYGEVFGLPIYTGGEVGGVLAGASPGVRTFGETGDYGAVSQFADTVRFQFILGGAWEPSIFGRLPKLDMECVHQNERISGCKEEPAAPAPAKPTPAPTAPTPTPTPAATATTPAPGSGGHRPGPGPGSGGVASHGSEVVRVDSGATGDQGALGFSGAVGASTKPRSPMGGRSVLPKGAGGSRAPAASTVPSPRSPLGPS